MYDFAVESFDNIISIFPDFTCIIFLKLVISPYCVYMFEFHVESSMTFPR